VWIKCEVVPHVTAFKLHGLQNILLVFIFTQTNVTGALNKRSHYQTSHITASVDTHLLGSDYSTELGIITIPKHWILHMAKPITVAAWAPLYITNVTSVTAF
jgi:hypothetical protein